MFYYGSAIADGHGLNIIYLYTPSSSAEMSTYIYIYVYTPLSNAYLNIM